MTISAPINTCTGSLAGLDLRQSIVAGGRDVHVVDLTIPYVRGSTRVVPVKGLTFYAPSPMTGAP